MSTNYTTLTGQRRLKVESIRDLTESTYVVRLEKGDLPFTAGQCVLLGLEGSAQHREYSVYSPVDAPYLEVLVKAVENGSVSNRLKTCTVGTALEVEGPIGFFTLADADVAGAPVVFVASGTGISPFHCMIGSYPDLNYTLVHGVRTPAEAYDRDCFDPQRYTLCTSRDAGGDYRGRVTAYLEQAPIATDARYYLCGNAAMIDDVYDILARKGVDNIRAEVYF
ncbi:MAG: ferredoxin--NADP+ reductase [Candidatus Promineifilaceae bacterium]|jgi:ferredoxin--NADP+ reductase